ncbi:cytochrome P450 9e2 [Solenopsis invicta]|uniref:cytochrome P450 9e2 n=1 Tax=Solenopsis invicta TaxID=13686 RepID=UPI0005960D16|nr:cytochrome P450 9e2 [Solenopsis invicta]
MELSTLLMTILAAGVCLYYFVLSKLIYFERLKIRYVQPIPLLGNMAQVIFRRISMAEHIQNIYNRFPDEKYVGFYDFTRPTFIIRDPEIISMIAIKHFDNFCNHSSVVNESLDPIASRNLVSLQGHRWRKMRRLLTPTFTSGKIKMMFGLMSECAENLINFVITESGKTGKTFDINDLFFRYANDTVATCAFGISVDSFKHPENTFFMIGKEGMTFNAWKYFKFFMNRNFPLFAKLLKLRLIGSKIENFFKDIVTNVVKVRDEQGIVRPDMIQLMIKTRNKDSGPEFDIDEMTAQAFVFFIAGFDSVATAMCFMAHEIGINPDVQKKLREEINDVLKWTDGKPTYEAINHMKYLDAVVNETLRLYQGPAFIDRICVTETKLPPATPDGEPITIKPGDAVWFPGFSLHRDPKYYPHPDKFDPERFMDNSVDKSVYMPFGIGPRICIANRFALMEAKVMLFYLLWKCDLEPDVKTKIPLMISKTSFTITAEEGFWLKLRARNSKAPVVCLSNGHKNEYQ